jgi:hypothetical protein
MKAYLWVSGVLFALGALAACGVVLALRPRMP